MLSSVVFTDELSEAFLSEVAGNLSEVVAVTSYGSSEPEHKALSEPVEVSFSIGDGDANTTAQCVFWDFDADTWSPLGCEASRDGQNITCR